MNRHAVLNKVHPLMAIVEGALEAKDNQAETEKTSQGGIECSSLPASAEGLRFAEHLTRT